MPDQDDNFESLKQRLHAETATIKWAELQRFFAQGKVLQVSSELDLIEVAVLFAEDDVLQMKQHIDAQQVAAPSNQQAKEWFAGDASLWSVVVAPFVLVQERA